MVMITADPAVAAHIVAVGRKGALKNITSRSVS